MPLPAISEFTAQNQGFFVFGVIVFALAIGSFLNVVILRMPRIMEQEWRREARQLLESDVTFASGASSEPISLSHPPSTCPKCGHRIRHWENVPVISYLFLRGRCGRCRERISVRYPLVEAATALLSVIVALRFGATWTGAFALLFTWALIALTMIDVDHQLLPDDITLPLLWLGLIVNAFGLLAPLEDAVWGAVLGYLALWSVYWAFKLLTGKEGMGYGDFKLLAALGAWMGAGALLPIVLLSSLIGAIVGGIALALQGRDRSTPIPFGPFIAAAGWVWFVFGDRLGALYARLFGLA